MPKTLLIVVCVLIPRVASGTAGPARSVPEPSGDASPSRPARAAERLTLSAWQRHLVDSGNASRYTIRAGDLDGEGRPDIVTGSAWYENPGAAGGSWRRRQLGAGLGNALIVHDFDADGDLDVLGDGFAWARNRGDGSFTLLRNIAAEGGFVQGAAAGAFGGGTALAVAYTYKNGDAVRMLGVPAQPASSRWTDAVIYDWRGKSKDIDLGDIDRDGDLDIAFVGRNAPTIEWLRNEGGGRFRAIELADSPAKINHRCRLGDINGDGRLDLVVGHKGRLVTWYQQPASAAAGWAKRVLADSRALAFDPLSIDVADMDRDGDLDVVVGEHTPRRPSAPQCSLYVFENRDGRGARWSRWPVHKGDEHHQGGRVVDIDGDGDLDILSVGWTHDDVLLYENRAIRSRY